MKKVKYFIANPKRFIYKKIIDESGVTFWQCYIDGGWKNWINNYCDPTVVFSLKEIKEEELALML